jgi:hypothetical protein
MAGTAPAADDDMADARHLQRIGDARNLALPLLQKPRRGLGDFSDLG